MDFPEPQAWVQPSVPCPVLRNRFGSRIPSGAAYSGLNEPMHGTYAHGVFGYTDESPPRFARLLVKLAEHRVNPEWDVITSDGLEELAIEAANLVTRAQVLTHQLKGKEPPPT